MSETVANVVLYTGPMSAGKTTAIHAKMSELDAIDVEYLAIQPSFDVRSVGLIRPKTLASEVLTDKPNCIRIGSLLDIGPEHLKGRKVLVVDEFTLFGFNANRHPIKDYYADSMRHLASLGVTAVYASGLNVAANRTLFPMLADAIRHGADVVMLTARCMAPAENGQGKCADVARNTQIYSRRRGLPYHPDTLSTLLPEGERPDLGYRPVCPTHLEVGRVASLNFMNDYPEAAQAV
jgi:thymidine kinase